MSEVNQFEVKDYLEEARTRYTQQFKNKEVFDKYIQLLLYGQEQLQLALKDLMEKRTLDTAQGVQLDQLGDIIGLQRGYLPAAAWATSHFGFFDDPDAKPFSDLFVNGDAGVFLDLSEQSSGNILWTDEVYRLFLKSKIFANTSNGTPEELITATKTILGVDFVDIVELGGAKLLLGFDKILTDVEKYILTVYGEGQGILPIPVGVGVEYLEVDGEFFGFDETPGALGFASFEVATEEIGYGEVYGTGYGAASPFGSSIGYGEAYGYAYGGGTSPDVTYVLVGGGNFASLL